MFLVAFALIFGVWSTRYQLGEFSRAGPGMFPLLVSCLLLLIGVISLARSFFVAPLRLEMKFKNMAFVLVGLCGFAAISEFLDMAAGIVFMVFCATFAGTSYSVVRNIKISAGLIGIAFALQHLLGLNLPLF